MDNKKNLMPPNRLPHKLILGFQRCVRCGKLLTKKNATNLCMKCSMKKY